MNDRTSGIGSSDEPRHEITLTQLRYFAAAAERRSMTEAARELFVAQSAVSAAIGQLEQQVGTQLFIRQRSKGLVLTRRACSCSATCGRSWSDSTRPSTPRAG